MLPVGLRRLVRLGRVPSNDSWENPRNDRGGGTRARREINTAFRATDVLRGRRSGNRMVHPVRQPCEEVAAGSGRMETHPWTEHTQRGRLGWYGATVDGDSSATTHQEGAPATRDPRTRRKWPSNTGRNVQSHHDGAREAMPRQSRFVERWPLSNGDSTWWTPTRSRTVRGKLPLPVARECLRGRADPRRRAHLGQQHERARERYSHTLTRKRR